VVGANVVVVSGGSVVVGANVVVVGGGRVVVGANVVVVDGGRVVVGANVVVVVGPSVVVGALVVVVGRAGEVCACAGTMTASTTGRIHRSGRSATPTMPPAIACLSRRRRSATSSSGFS
jgi:hypothetical protein